MDDEKCITSLKLLPLIFAIFAIVFTFVYCSKERTGGFNMHYFLLTHEITTKIALAKSLLKPHIEQCFAASHVRKRQSTWRHQRTFRNTEAPCTALRNSTHAETYHPFFSAPGHTPLPSSTHQLRNCTPHFHYFADASFPTARSRPRRWAARRRGGASPSALR